MLKVPFGVMLLICSYVQCKPKPISVRQLEQVKESNAEMYKVQRWLGMWVNFHLKELKRCLTPNVSWVKATKDCESHKTCWVQAFVFCVRGSLLLLTDAKGPAIHQKVSSAHNAKGFIWKVKHMRRAWQNICM